MRVRLKRIWFNRVARGPVPPILFVFVARVQTGPAGPWQGTLRINDAAPTPAELWQSLASTAWPRLWLPKREHMFQVDSIPVPGSGKIDLRGAKARAVELACPEEFEAIGHAH